MINDDDKCFQYTATNAFNHEVIGRKCEEYQKLSLLWINITGHEWITDQEKVTRKSLRKIIQHLLLMWYMFKKMKTYPPSISKQNLSHENQIILLMIPDGEGWYYLSVKKSS